LWWLFLHRRLRSDNEAQLTSSRFCSHRRVLASGCHSFLFEWLKKVSQPSLAEPFGSDKGVNRINSRLFLLSLERHRPIADPFVVLEGRNLRDSGFILLDDFSSNFLSVLF